jgi:hypothetical protein
VSFNLCVQSRQRKGEARRKNERLTGMKAPAQVLAMVWNGNRKP